MTQTIDPDAHLVNATIDVHNGVLDKQLSLSLLRMELCIRTLGFTPDLFKKDELLKIFYLTHHHHLSFDKTPLKIDLFVVKKEEKLSIWPIIGSKALEHILTRIMGTQIHLKTTMAKVDSIIVNNVPESICTKLIDASGAISELSSSNITATASISKEEIQQLLSSIHATSMTDEEFTDAVCAKRLLKYLPSSNNMQFINLQFLLDTGFRKAHGSFTSL